MSPERCPDEWHPHKKGRRRFPATTEFDPHVWRLSPAYDFIPSAIREDIASWEAWPSPSAYNAWTSELAGVAGRRLEFSELSKAQVQQEGGYDRFIERHGVIPTRSRNWHDLFNAVIWCCLPRTKVGIWRLQLSQGFGKCRTPLQNQLTHFDERGLILVASDPWPLEATAGLRWRELFWERRHDFLRDALPLCVGHAVLEALLQPYVGLMGKAWLLRVPSWLLNESPRRRLVAIDKLAGASLATGCRRLAPLPVLGIPGWYGPNNDEAFYLGNSRYFRTCRLAAGQRPHPAEYITQVNTVSYGCW